MDKSGATWMGWQAGMAWVYRASGHFKDATGKRDDGDIGAKYPVVIINRVQYLGPPGPFSFPDSRDLLEVLGGLSLAEREAPREDPLGQLYD